MKKIFSIMFLLGACLFVNAQTTNETTKTKTSYQSFGINVGSRNGLSYEKRINSFGFILDVDWQINNTVWSEIGRPDDTEGIFRWDFGISPNFVGHKSLKVSEYGNLSWYGGAGFGVGLSEDFPPKDTRYIADKDGIMAKIGIHAITGIEYKFKKIPLCLAADFRPGWACYINDYLFDGLDWSLGLSIRYCY